VNSWLRHQKHALTAALRRLAGQPVSTLLTALAMGVALSLPAGLYLMLGNLSRLAGDLPAQPEISVYLADDASAAQKAALAERLKQADVERARFIARDEALAALSAAQGLDDVAAGLPDNPLPDAWVVRPRDASRGALIHLHDELARQPGVAETQLDSAWAERLQSLLALGRTGVWLLAALFAVALAAISGNAIRAQVLARRDEILVSRLIGATDRYVRRPFLYLGAVQGLLGGLAAAAVLAIAGAALRGPIEHLATLYGSAWRLHPPAAPEILALFAFTTLFGWLGAWISVGRTLRRVEAGG
jgi:cell division transport system permease protein